MKFEYYIRHGMETYDTIARDLDDLGSKGWELVTVTGGGVSGSISRWIFKRQVFEKAVCENPKACTACNPWHDEGNATNHRVSQCGPECR